MRRGHGSAVCTNCTPPWLAWMRQAAAAKHLPCCAEPYPHQAGTGTQLACSPHAPPVLPACSPRSHCHHHVRGNFTLHDGGEHLLHWQGV